MSFKTIPLILSIIFFCSCLPQTTTSSDVIYIEGKNIYTSKGEPLVIRGVNEMLIWSDDPTGAKVIPEIAGTGANTLRIVWLTNKESPAATPENLDRALQNTANQQMFPMPELHGATGNWELLQKQVDYWTDSAIVAVLKKHEHYLLLNIANECGDHDVDAKTFLEGYKLAIDRIRAVGLKCPLVIDASGWGQDLDILLETGPELLQHDPLSNLIFSIHMWWVADDGSTQRIIEGIERSVKMDIPLIVGEFAPMGVNCARYIDYHTIIEQCEKHQIGWLAWSWGAVKNRDCSEMDMTRGERRGKVDGLTDWGLEVAITHPYSIKNTSIKPALK